MKPTRPLQKYRAWWRRASVPGAWMVVSSLWAADTNAPPAAAPAAPAEKPATPMTPQEMFEGGTEPLNNWIDFSTGGFITQGNKAQLQQRHQAPGGPFGGIEDFHYTDALNKTTTLTMDGRALFDERDYKLKLGVEREKFGYLRLSYTQFRDWSNGDGGFYPPTGAFYGFPSSSALGLDRGKLIFEGGLTLENRPNITFKYTHDFRQGEESSTSWGPVHPALGVTQALSPSFYDLREHSDSIQLDLTHTLKKTDFGLGLRYEFGKLDDALKISQYPGEPAAQFITDRQNTSYNLLNAHAFTETWFKKNLMFSTGYSYTDLGSDFTGSRIYGSDFDVGYVPGALSGAGYSALAGSTRLHEYVADANLFYKPAEHLSIVPSIRIQKEDTDASAAGSETLLTFTPAPFTGNSSLSDLDVRERLDATYNGITNWVIYARGEWAEGRGDLTANGGLVPIAGIGIAPVQEQTDEQRFFQKYSVGARWYPLRAATIDAGGYYKKDSFDYSHNLDSTPNNGDPAYPGFLVMQNFRTYDANVRLTLRPWRTVTLVSRYEYQLSTIQTAPDPVSGLPSVESSTMTSHILAQDVSWAPWSRLSLQAGVNYVRSVTKTPASDFTQAILNARNNYWTVTSSAGFIVDDRTDVKLTYFYYHADDYQDNSGAGVPYGAGGEEHSITATIVRQLSKNLRISLKYGFYQVHDQLSGGNDNNTGQLIYSSLHYRF